MSNETPQNSCSIAFAKIEKGAAGVEAGRSKQGQKSKGMSRTYYFSRR